MKTRGISVSLWKSVQKGFDKRMSELGFRRDVFLANVVREELPRLDAEVASPVSPQGAISIRHQLKRLDKEVVTFRLPIDLANSLDEVCKKKNIVRDAFFNRLLFALCAKPNIFLSLTEVGELEGIPEVLAEEGWQTHGEEFSKGPLDAAASILKDPLWVIRACLDYASRLERVEGLYTFYGVTLSSDRIKGIQGLNVCYSEPKPEVEIDLSAFLGGDDEPKGKSRSVK